MARLPPNYISRNKKNQSAFNNPPPTVRDLREVTHYMGSSTFKDPRAFGYVYDGKLKSSKYGSLETLDLDLCLETWITAKSCRLGNDCLWCHEELTTREALWMISMGANCVEGLKGCRMLPERPKMTVWNVFIAR